MKPRKGQSLSEWMCYAVPELVKHGKALDAAAEEARTIYSEFSPDTTTRVSYKSAVVDRKFTRAQVEKMCEDAGIKYQEGDEENIVVFEASNGGVDRHGDIVMPEGGDFTNYRKNPVFLYVHNNYAIPIGAGIKVKMENGANGKTIVATMLFQGVTEEAKTLLKLCKLGYLKAVSIGFKPKAGGVKFPTEEERKTMGMGPYGVIFSAWELLEISLCPVPSNPAALAREVAKAFGPGARKFMREEGLVEVPDDVPMDEATLDAFVQESVERAVYRALNDDDYAASIRAKHAPRIAAADDPMVKFLRDNPMLDVGSPEYELLSRIDNLNGGR